MRLKLQILWTALSNGYIFGFFQGKIYQGQGKQLCLPGLNCYSCPSALGACPVGAFQAQLTTAEKSIPFYAMGFLVFFGALLGRGVCGFLCPFGLFQDLLHKIPSKKIKSPKFLDKLRLPWVILVVFLLLLPLFRTNQFNMSDPAFCKWICPSGTLLGGIPLLLLDENLRGNISTLFYWKFFLLLAITLLSVVNYRPFCRYFCPLGAFYGMFNSLSLYRMEYNETTCTHCETCHRTCKLDIPVTETLNASGCVRCGDCIRACPHHCLSMTTEKLCHKEKNYNQ